MAPLSILIVAKNEERNIARTLEMCRFAPEVFVVDNESTDRTVEIARSFPNTKIYSSNLTGYAERKNWALDSLPWSHSWIFILDADERFTSELQKEVERTVSSSSPTAECWYVNRRFIFLGRWIRHAGWYPVWNLRFFKRGMARYEKRSMDEHMIPTGTIGYLAHDLIHENLNGIEEWIAKHNRYSTLEMNERTASRTNELKENLFSSHSVERKRAFKRFFYRLPARPLFKFFYMYIVRSGWRDGYPGLALCILQAVQEFHINLKMREKKALL